MTEKTNEVANEQYQWAPYSDVFDDSMSQNVILGASAVIVMGLVWLVANYAGELSRFLSW